MLRIRDALTERPVAIISLVYKSIRLILLAGVIGALGGYLAFQLIKPRWTASVTVQIGQVSTPTQAGVASRQLENTLTTADRFNSPASRLKVLVELGLQEPGGSDQDANVIFDNLRATTGKSPDLVTLQATGYSREQAATALNTSYTLLTREHQVLFAPPVQRMKQELASNEARMNQIEKEYASSYEWLRSAAVKESSSGTARDILVTNMASLMNNQALELKQRIVLLQEALEPTRSYPTRSLGDVYSPQRPATPGAFLLVLGGIAFGVVVATLFVLARDTRGRGISV